jgi:hypothetical protein
MKFEFVVEASGLSVGVATDGASKPETVLGPVAVGNIPAAVPVQPGLPVVADRVHDLDSLRQQLAEDGFTLVAPHSTGRKWKRKADGRRLRRYRRRYIVERSFAWTSRKRRLFAAACCRRVLYLMPDEATVGVLCHGAAPVEVDGGAVLHPAGRAQPGNRCPALGVRLRSGLPCVRGDPALIDRARSPDGRGAATTPPCRHTTYRLFRPLSPGGAEGTLRVSYVPRLVC